MQVDLQPVDYGIALNREVKEHSVHISLLSGCYSAGRRRCEHLMRAACATMSDAHRVGGNAAVSRAFMPVERPGCFVARPACAKTRVWILRGITWKPCRPALHRC
ncbi:MAG: hypothetical protein CM15mP74_19440 [Halieaceae bacterium]|nr:MAG: hypothetical protein CM15mP74_19440 [Halieaceae bacterium]